MMSEKGTGKKSWASMLGEGEEEEKITCDSCGVEFPADQLKPFKSGSLTKNYCSPCHALEEKKKQERLDRKKEATLQKVAVQPVHQLIPSGLQETLDNLAASISTLPTRDDLNQVLSMKGEILDALKGIKPYSEPTQGVDLIPTERVVLKELASSKLGYISHYDTFKSRWGMHHNAAIKAILAKLWEDGVLLRDNKNRYVLDTSAAKEKLSGILGEEMSQEKFEEMKGASDDKVKASSTVFRTKKQAPTLGRKTK